MWQSRTIHSLEELQSLAAELASLLKPSCICLLEGKLGAGKTTLVQFLGQNWGIGQRMTSPTFNLMNVYMTESLAVFHLDLYRLQGQASAEDFRFDELAPVEFIALVEWPERGQINWEAMGYPVHRIAIELDSGELKDTEDFSSLPRTISYKLSLNP